MAAPVSSSDRPVQRRRVHRLVLLVPYLWSVAAIPAVNQLRARPLGVPALLWWALAGVVVTSGCIGAVWLLDRRAARNVPGDGAGNGDAR